MGNIEKKYFRLNLICIFTSAKANATSKLKKKKPKTPKIPKTEKGSIMRRKLGKESIGKVARKQNFQNTPALSIHLGLQ